MYIFAFSTDPDNRNNFEFNVKGSLEFYDVEISPSFEDFLSELACYENSIAILFVKGNTNDCLNKIRITSRVLRDDQQLVCLHQVPGAGVVSDILDSGANAAYPYEDTLTFVSRTLPSIVKATQRQSQGVSAVQEIGAVRIDRQSKGVYVNGEDLSMPRREYQILDCILSRPDMRTTKAQIFRHIYNGAEAGEVSETIIESHMSKLKQKLRKACPDLSGLITSERFMGYTLHSKVAEDAAKNEVGLSEVDADFKQNQALTADAI